MKYQKDWRNIRNVSVRVVHYTSIIPYTNRERYITINTFDTLDEAIDNFHNYFEYLFKKSEYNYGWSFRSQTTGRWIHCDKWHYPPEFRDQNDLIIPLWKLVEAFEHREYVPNKWIAEKLIYSEGGEQFRKGVVPRTGNRRRRWGRGWYRRPRTNQERRENAQLWEDEDALDYDIQPRRRGHVDLPTSWDDVRRSDVRDRNWKRHRSKQWKA